jgi:hypothetical protein
MAASTFAPDTPEDRCAKKGAWASSENLRRWLQFMHDAWPVMGTGVDDTMGPTSKRLWDFHFDLPHDAPDAFLEDKAGEWAARIDVQVEATKPNEILLVLPVNQGQLHWRLLMAAVSARLTWESGRIWGCLGVWGSLGVVWGTLGLWDSGIVWGSLGLVWG